MPKTIHTPRDELICGKLDKALFRAKIHSDVELVDILCDIVSDANRMEMKLYERKREVDRFQQPSEELEAALARVKTLEEERQKWWDAMSRDAKQALEQRIDNVRMRKALEKLARLGNGELPGNSIGNTIALDALYPQYFVDTAQLEAQRPTIKTDNTQALYNALARIAELESLVNTLEAGEAWAESDYKKLQARITQLEAKPTVRMSEDEAVEIMMKASSGTVGIRSMKEAYCALLTCGQLGGSAEMGDVS